jgi:DNA-3-methyladenine glycosylase II
LKITGLKLVEYLHNVPEVRAGLEHLVKRDPVFKKLDINLDNFLWPYMGPEFPGLVRIIIGQQLSVKAAASLWKRFQQDVPKVTPKHILKLSAEDMRALGLSRQKAAYIRGLSEAVAEGTFDVGRLANLSEAEIIEAVTSLKGMGPWSAQMYLIFGLARPDIWAPGDLGIQEGMRRYLGLSKRPSAEKTIKMGDRFKPHRTAASLLLWRIPPPG